MGLGLAQPKAQLIWAGPWAEKFWPKPIYKGMGLDLAQPMAQTIWGWVGPKNFGPNPSLFMK